MKQTTMASFTSLLGCRDEAFGLEHRLVFAAESAMCDVVWRFRDVDHTSSQRHRGPEVGADSLNRRLPR
jgi:hypothetical protein